MQCQKESNSEGCACAHTECSRHGVCCECLRYHLNQKELPACCFPDDVAKTDERSFQKFIELNNK